MFLKTARGVTEFLLIGSAIAVLGVLVAALLEVSKARTFVNTRCLTTLEGTVSGRLGAAPADDPELLATRKRLGAVNNYIVVILALVVAIAVLGGLDAFLDRKIEAGMLADLAAARAAAK